MPPFGSLPWCQNLPFFFCIISVTPWLQSLEIQSLHFPLVNGNQALIPFNAMVLWEFTKAFDNSCKTASPAPNRLIFLFFFIHYWLVFGRPTPPPGDSGYVFTMNISVRVCSSQCCSCHLAVGPSCSQHSHSFLDSTFTVYLSYLTSPSGTALTKCPALVKQYIRVAPYVNPTWQDMDHRISVTEGKKELFRLWLLLKPNTSIFSLYEMFKMLQIRFSSSLSFSRAPEPVQSPVFQELLSFLISDYWVMKSPIKSVSFSFVSQIKASSLHNFTNEIKSS